MDRNELRAKTTKLIEIHEEVKEIFQRTLESEKTPDFYDEVKPFSDEVKKHADEWLALAKKWMMEEKPPYLYIQQLEDIYYNMLHVSVLAFQKETKKKRFYEMIQSINYILNGVLRELS